ncbi:endonuclease/exonuclease/phosphatase [Nodosilinea sp. FACHB-13]|uniref:endonuclease/exonuclease/phosphatase n=1 Tax=Cyanophyceae TaxID=3028117 RepID=UPI0016834E47|nr:endonuclease/exonuclease/phosphatase [Nodosilinea sp. FACHB-13]MBD2110014.1 endonuclease/exonuclease/phosphatase [Nodosilinea sp. FACHB-13]
MADLTTDEWAKINALLESNPYKYGIPKRTYGSAVLGSFNIRKLGNVSSRSTNTWNFLANICRRFDLLSVQEIMGDLEGFDKLVSLMGPEYDAIVSDKTGQFPGEQGLGERLGFIYNRNLIRRGNIVSDVSYDRTKVLKTIVDNYKVLVDTATPYVKYLQSRDAWQESPVGPEPKAPKIQIPVFLNFIRQPFCASFEIIGHPETKPYKIMAVNAHLYFGDSVEDRRQEFDALMEWILGGVQEEDNTSFPNFILMGDLNLSFSNPKRDRPRIERHIKTFNQDMQASGRSINVNFPFLDVHKGSTEPFRTNARLSETFDQIGLFSHDPRLPSYDKNPKMGPEPPQGPDYGVVNFVELFREALELPSIESLSSQDKKEFYRKFEHEVSDHLPIWLRLPLPEV